MNARATNKVVAEDNSHFNILEKQQDRVRAQQETAANNYTVERQRLTDQINRVQKQLVKKNITRRKRAQLKKRLVKLKQGGRRAVK